MAGSSYSKQKKTPPKDNYCNKDHHLDKRCMGKHGAKPAKGTEHEDSISATLCQITSADPDSTKKASVDHHVFDKFTKAWLRRRSKSQPYVRLQVNIQREDYDHFVPQARSFVSAMADTGCQSCLAGLKVVKKLGVSVRDLIPVNIKMQAANNDNIRILGAAILRLLGRSNVGEERSTRQMVYVTDNTDKVFLSREACVDLGIIPNTFPTIGEAEETEPANSNGTTDASLPQQECQCPKWKNPPRSPPPTTPSHRSQQGETPAISPRSLRLQHVQYL